MMKNMVIKFTNMKAVRVGKGVRELRQQASLLPKQLAATVGITESHLYSLEEGYVSEVQSKTLEDIAEAVGVRMRGTSTYDDLVNLFLYYSVGKDDTATLI